MLKRFFEPYAEYTLRTTLSEEALRGVLEKEYRFLVCLKKDFSALLHGSERSSFHLVRSKEEIVLYPRFCRGRNSLRGNVHFTMRKDPHSPESILYVAIRPPDSRWFCILWLGFLLVWIVCAVGLRQWEPLLVLPFMAGGFFLVMHLCRVFAEKEIPQIRSSFEELIRKLEMEENDHAVR
ncbi:MAG: hypothetical protein J5944_07210 [Lentisphaeria bacterium]|nr:hypothetical protein [Lentisphaeria bacterium]